MIAHCTCQPGSVIQTIRQAKDVETAKANLIERFKLTEIQAQAILDMQLRRLAALERQKMKRNTM
jgi:DNA gyrase subunit A